MKENGNVPPEDVQTVRRMANIAAHVTDAVPGDAPDGWLAVTYELVLEALMQEWVEHQTEDLDDQDAADLSDIVRAAAGIAMAQDPEHQDTAYRVILGGWLADWVQNWNIE